MSRQSSASVLPANTLKPSNSRADGKRPRSHAGSGSDRDTAGSGGERSDGARKKKLTLTFGKASSNSGTPLASRAGSPDPRSGDTAGKVNASVGSILVSNTSVPVGHAGGNASIGSGPAGLNNPSGTLSL